MQKNEKIVLNITDITADGSGVARHEGMAVFVPLTAVGDEISAHIIKVKKNYAVARVDEIITPSKDRIPVDCENFRQCGGCAFRHISYEAECGHKYNRVYEAMKRIGGVDIRPQPIVAARTQYGYRNKSQQPIAQNGRAGFFAAHSHRIVPISSCKIIPEIFIRITGVVEKWIKDFGISIYDESSLKGLLRNIYIRSAQHTGEIMVTLVINGDKIPFEEELSSLLKREVGDRLLSLQININKEDTNVILGESCRLLYGKEYITDVLSGVEVRLSPKSFYQVNREMAQLLYEKVGQYAEPSGKTILDLYCGVGTIGLSLAAKAKEVIGVEIVPEAVEDAKSNAALNKIENAQFLCADAAGAAELLAQRKIHPEVVIVDPPRKGCSEQLLEIIARDFCPQRLIYVSCDPATLARDVAVLSTLGYELKEYEPYDLFPRTGHVETVVLLSHKTPDSHINVKVEFGEGEGKVPLDKIAERAKEYQPAKRVTYKMIQEYVKEKHGFGVHTANIAEVKRSRGLPMYDALNKVETLKNPQKHQTSEKMEAIKEALKHFKLI